MLIFIQDDSNIRDMLLLRKISTRLHVSIFIKNSTVWILEKYIHKYRQVPNYSLSYIHTWYMMI